MITLTIFLSKIPTFTAKSVLKMKGDDFNIIYERNYRRSFLFTKSYVHDDMVAEDIVAESLVKYWRLVSAGENEITEALLLTILKNKALNYLRHKAIHDAAIENLEEIKNRELSIRISTLEACDPKEIFSDEVNRIIHKTLKNLPEQTHRIFEMSRFENKTVKEPHHKRCRIPHNQGFKSFAYQLERLSTLILFSFFLIFFIFPLGI